MLVITYLDGQQLTVATDQWAVDGPVLKAGTFVTPIAHVRCWETATPPPATALSEPVVELESELRR